jgi:hypothetical protein
MRGRIEWRVNWPLPLKREIKREMRGGIKRSGSSRRAVTTLTWRKLKVVNEKRISCIRFIFLYALIALIRVNIMRPMSYEFSTFLIGR